MVAFDRRRFLKRTGRMSLVLALDPGITATVPGMVEMGAQPVPQGVASVVWAATLTKSGLTGGFFRDGQSLL